MIHIVYYKTDTIQHLMKKIIIILKINVYYFNYLNCVQGSIIMKDQHHGRPGARFSKEVQPTLSLNLNSELTYSEMGNSEFSVTEQLNCVSLLNSK